MSSREPSLTIARIRTLALWSLMRLLPHPKLREWRAAGRLRILDPLMLRGWLSVRGGLGARLWLSASRFDPAGAQAYGVLTGAHEPMVQEALRRAVPRGGVVFDVGANIGFTALVAARLTGPHGQVVAFEPQPDSAEAVRANAAANGFNHLHVIEAAVGAATGSAELIVVADSLWTRLASVGDHDHEVARLQVQVISLDEQIAATALPVPDVVKIDVEGAELEVLAGLTKTLSDHRPTVICEMHGKNQAFCDFMHEAGYRVLNLDGPEPVAQADGNVHAYAEPWPTPL